MGDAGPESNGWNWNFRGQRILEATLAKLQSGSGNFTLGMASGTRLLVGGCSAGARGAVFSADSVAAMVPSTVQARRPEGCALEGARGFWRDGAAGRSDGARPRR